MRRTFLSGVRVSVATSSGVASNDDGDAADVVILVYDTITDTTHPYGTIDDDVSDDPTKDAGAGEATSGVRALCIRPRAAASRRSAAPVTRAPTADLAANASARRSTR